MKPRHVVWALFGVALPLLAVAASEIAPSETPERTSFDPKLVIRGAQLSAIGNCNVCHTSLGGRPYAGGRPLKTPFGTIYSTNITPDPETGIGRWSETAFSRAMREGVDRQGRHLYPAFPYDHFTKVADEDIRAIYAFMMTREPVRAETPRNELPFPVNIRLLIGAWKALFFERGGFQTDSSRSAEWNRGAYLAEGLGHCGACHTPRNYLGAEKKDRPYSGGEAEDWHAPALNMESPAPVPWSAEQMYAYLRDGIDDVHSIATGPMAPVVHNLAVVPEQDVKAIATYIASLGVPSTPDSRKRAEEAIARAKVGGRSSAGTDGVKSGATINAGACADCHDHGRGPSSASALQLALSTTVAISTPRNLIHIIVDGIAPPEGERGRWMPAFAGALTPQQVADLVIFLRADSGTGPPWRDVEGEVKKIMSAGKTP